MNAQNVFLNTNDSSYISVSFVHICTCGEPVDVNLKQTYVCTKDAEER